MHRVTAAAEVASVVAAWPSTRTSTRPAASVVTMREASSPSDLTPNAATPVPGAGSSTPTPSTTTVASVSQPVRSTPRACAGLSVALWVRPGGQTPGFAPGAPGAASAGVAVSETVAITARVSVTARDHFIRGKDIGGLLEADRRTDTPHYARPAPDAPTAA